MSDVSDTEFEAVKADFVAMLPRYGHLWRSIWNDENRSNESVQVVCDDECCRPMKSFVPESILTGDVVDKGDPSSDSDETNDGITPTATTRTEEHSFFRETPGYESDEEESLDGITPMVATRAEEHTFFRDDSGEVASDEEESYRENDDVSQTDAPAYMGDDESVELHTPGQSRATPVDLVSDDEEIHTITKSLRKVVIVDSDDEEELLKPRRVILDDDSNESSCDDDRKPRARRSTAILDTSSEEVDSVEEVVQKVRAPRARVKAWQSVKDRRGALDTSSEEEEFDDGIVMAEDDQQENFIVEDDEELDDNDFIVDDEDEDDDALDTTPAFISKKKVTLVSSKAPGTKITAKNRDSLAQNLFVDLDNLAFDGILAEHTTVEWSNKLQTTAGRTFMTRRGPSRTGRIELSTKVLDRMSRLQSTLLHEMCHAAAWIVDNNHKPPHGSTFWKWANQGMQRIPNVIVTTRHDYEIVRKYAWACTEPKCGAIIRRDSRSVNPGRQVCGRCKGILMEIDPASIGSAQGFTPRKKAAPSAYNQFVKTESAGVRRRLELQGPVSQSDVLKECARLWREQKATPLGNHSNNN